MNFLKKLVMKWMGGGVIEKALSFLPLNGKKSVISAALTALLIVVSMSSGDSSAVVSWITGALDSAGAVKLLTDTQIAELVSAAGTLVFLFHKVLKKMKDTR